MGKVYTRFQTKTAQKPLPNGAVHTYIACIREYPGEGVSLTRKQPTFRYATSGFPAKWRLRNERKNSILMMRHNPDLGSASDCFFFFCFNQSEALPRSGRWRVISMDCSRFNTENCSVTKRDDYVIMLNKKEMYSNQPGEKKKTRFRKMIQKTG